MRLNVFRLIQLACAAVLLTACIDSEQAELDAVAHHATTITAAQATYAPNQDITLTWSEMPGNQLDWVAIATAGSGPTAGFVRYAFINGQVAGSQVFSGLPVGNYEARAYVDNTYTVIAQSTFTVAEPVVGTAAISTNKPTYGPGESVVVTWSNLPGNQGDWIAINLAGSGPTAGFVRYAFVGGQANGSMSFTDIPTGSYEARAYLDYTYNILATTTFTVGTTTSTATVTTDNTAYGAGDVVTVSWTGLPGNATDWIAVYPAGSADNGNATAWQYTNGQAAGSFQFSNLPTGLYEARAYLNNTFTVAARSATFSVAFDNACTPAALRPILQGVTSGELTIGATETTASAALAVPLDTSILFSSVRENEPSPRHGGVQCTLHGDIAMGPVAGVTCYRNTAGTDFAGSNGIVTVRWSVATFTSGVTVQRGATVTSGATPVTLTAVDPAQSFVLLGGVFNTGSGWGNNEFVRAQLTSGTSLLIETNAPSTEVPWQVVSMVGASVQRGTASLSSAQTDLAVTIPTAPAGTIVLASYTTDNVSGIAAAAMMLGTQLADPTTLAFHRGAGGSTLQVAYEVISLPFATASGVSTFAAGQTTATHGVPGLSGTASVALAGSQAINGQSSGSTTYAGTDLDIVGEAQATLTASAGLVTVQRTATQATASIPWAAIDFSRDCTGL